MRRLLLLFPLVLGAVACGGSGSSNAPYTLGPTAKCLREHGFHVSTSDAEVSVVIASADGGGLRAWHTKAGNQLQIAFTAGEAAATEELRAIRRVAPPELKKRLADVTRIKRNAVLLWTIAPTAADDRTSVDCLSS